jgi:hypothetical protein
MLVPSADFSTGDDMQQLLWTVLGTRMFGVEFVELFDIIIKYQNSRETKVFVKSFRIVWKLLTSLASID